MRRWPASRGLRRHCGTIQSLSSAPGVGSPARRNRRSKVRRSTNNAATSRLTVHAVGARRHSCTTGCQRSGSRSMPCRRAVGIGRRAGGSKKTAAASRSNSRCHRASLISDHSVRANRGASRLRSVADKSASSASSLTSMTPSQPARKSVICVTRTGVRSSPPRTPSLASLVHSACHSATSRTHRSYAKPRRSASRVDASCTATEAPDAVAKSESSPVAGRRSPVAGRRSPVAGRSEAHPLQCFRNCNCPNRLHENLYSQIRRCHLQTLLAEAQQR